MKGVVFNLLEGVVTEAFGANVWDDLLDQTGLSGAYTSLGNYDDGEIEALAAAAAAKAGMDREQVLRWFGEKAIPLLAAHYPDFFTPHRSSRTFLNGVNDIIHAEVRKLYPGAACPHFGMKVDDGGALQMIYRSDRRMCALAEGFIRGAAAWYGERVEVTQPCCTLHGDDHCDIRVEWIEATSRAAA
jgi:hypothetical protein